MRRFVQDMNPTLRGFLIIGVVALLVMVLNLYVALATVGALLRIAFFLAIAFVLYLLWRDRLRGDIAMWSSRSRWVFYGGVGLVVADLAVAFWPDGESLAGWEALAFVLVLAFAGFAMWRVWRDERHYA